MTTIIAVLIHKLLFFIIQRSSVNIPQSAIPPTATANLPLLCFLSYHSAFADFEKGFLGALDNKTCIFYFLDLTDNAAVRYYFVIDP